MYYPMSLADWNHQLLLRDKTKVLRFADDYANMQTGLEDAIRRVNNNILDLNKSNNVSTPLIHRSIIHNRKGKLTFKYNLLVDECHPGPLMCVKIRDSIQVAILKNNLTN